MAYPIYVVEDEPAIAELIRFNLELSDYRVELFSTAENCLARLKMRPEAVALFILDVMLPGISGFELCAKLRHLPSARGASFLFLTARGAEEDKLRGFAAGADDYLTKPFSMRELEARVQALYQRASARLTEERGEGPPLSAELERSQPISYQDLRIDANSRRVLKAGREVDLTRREFELLYQLVTHLDQVFTREDLLLSVWGYDYGGETRTVDVHIRQLRLKLEDRPEAPRYIETVRGVGYRMKRELVDEA